MRVGEDFINKPSRRLVGGVPTKVLQRGEEDLRNAHRIFLQLSRSRVANHSAIDVSGTQGFSDNFSHFTAATQAPVEFADGTGVV